VRGEAPFALLLPVAVLCARRGKRSLHYVAPAAGVTFRIGRLQNPPIQSFCRRIGVSTNWRVLRDLHKRVREA